MDVFKKVVLPRSLRAAGEMPLLALFVLLLLAVVLFGGLVAPPSLWASSHPGGEELSRGSLPLYDLVIMLYMTGSVEDVGRFREASKSWLAMRRVMGMSVAYTAIVCADDPGAWRVFGLEHAALVPCVHGYKSLVTKAIEGYKYVASHYNFRFVMKADVDTAVPLQCIVEAVRRVDRQRCKSFGMGEWYPARTQEVWLSSDEPWGDRFGNDAYAIDTGNDFYSPYPLGWTVIWSGDVARFLGMFGAGTHASDSTIGAEGDLEAPRWRRSWTVEDAAIGTFLVGLDLCRLPLPCHLASGLTAESVQSQSRLADGGSITIGRQGEIRGFSGPYSDDVPGYGDLDNLQVGSLGHCAARCLSLGTRCRSFEFSPTATGGDPAKNCQLASSSAASGQAFGDFKLYVRDSGS